MKSDDYLDDTIPDGTSLGGDVEDDISSTPLHPLGDDGGGGDGGGGGNSDLETGTLGRIRHDDDLFGIHAPSQVFGDGHRDEHEEDAWRGKPEDAGSEVAKSLDQGGHAGSPFAAIEDGQNSLEGSVAAAVDHPTEEVFLGQKGKLDVSFGGGMGICGIQCLSGCTNITTESSHGHTYAELSSLHG